MALADLESGDALRIIKFSDDTTIAEFFVISDDTIEEDLIDSDVSVRVPVYGNPFLLMENPVGSRYTNSTVNLEGTPEAFDAVVSQCAVSGSFQVVKLVVGGDFMDQIDYLKGVVVNVSRKRKITRDGWVEGSISFIIIP